MLVCFVCIVKGLCECGLGFTVEREDICGGGLAGGVMEGGSRTVVGGESLVHDEKIGDVLSFLVPFFAT